MSITTEISRIQTAKILLKSAIENKGVSVGNITLDEYYTKINAIPTSTTPTIIKSKCYVTTLSTDQSSGKIELTSSDSEIAQHRSDSSFFVAVSSLEDHSESSSFVRGTCANIYQSSSTVSVKNYGYLTSKSSSGSLSHINNAYPATSSSGLLYIDSTGKVIVKTDTSRILRAGKYLIVCGWE